MRKTNTVVFALVVFILASCGSAETKADPTLVPVEKNDPATDTVSAATTQPSTKENINDKLTKTSGQARGITTEPSPGGNDILANIDQYLQITPQYTVSPSGGFTGCMLKVTNTLNDASFQKAIIELSILKADGSLLRNDYYTVINIEAAGGFKMVRVPDNKQGAKLVTHVIKVKSNELTNGETVLAGTHLAGN